jgi:hypothetical protein
VANRGTLDDPRWVRTEVEEFRKHHPNIWADSPENPGIGANGKFVK